MKDKLKKYIEENLETKKEVKKENKIFKKLRKLILEENIDESYEGSSINEYQIPKLKNDIIFSKSNKEPIYEEPQVELPKELEIPKFLKPVNENLDEYIGKHQKYSSFQTLLFETIDKKELKDSDVYNKVHIDRRLFSKIRSDKNYHPSKETVILLGMSLELSIEELEELLDTASYSLPKNNHYDLIIRFCFINKIYKIKDVNELLEEYNCKLFNY